MPREGFIPIEPFSKIPERTQEVQRSIPSSRDYLAMLHANGLEKHAEVFRTVIAICEAVKKRDGRALLVGGSVRDMVLKKISKDFDIEIYGLQPKEVEQLAGQFGKIKSVGTAFGILKLSFDGIDIDISLPRIDSKIGEGHRGFEVKVDPFMSIQEAARRRDFTMNALAANPLTGELFDYYGGLDDLRQRRLRTTDPERFKDDPLRVLRALQFIGRFGLFLDRESAILIQEMAPSVRELPKDRILEEWRKLLLKAEKPSVGLAAGMALGVFHQIHPMLPPLMETPQEFEWHPEGDVWIHTLMAIDEAAAIARREQLDDDHTFLILIATLCHDFGKVLVTEYKDGRLKSHGHEVAGGEPAKKFLAGLGLVGDTRERVVKLVTNHLMPSMFYIDEVIRGRSVSDKAFRNLATRIYPATIYDLVLIAEADHRGRGPFIDQECEGQLLIPTAYPAGEWTLKRARDINIEKNKPADVIQGRDLITLGHTPSLHFGSVINLANQLRDEGISREKILEHIYRAGEGIEHVIKRLSTLIEQ